MTTSRKRALLGFFLAPLAALIVYWFTLMISDVIVNGWSNPFPPLRVVIVDGWPFAYLTMLLVGVPIYLLLKRFKSLRLLSGLTAGTCAGALIALLWSRFLGNDDWLSLSAICFAGTAAAATFWSCINDWSLQSGESGTVSSSR